MLCLWLAGLWVGGSGCGSATSEAAEPEAVKVVVVAVVEAGALSDERVYLGVVRAQQRVTLAFGVPGRVASLDRLEGTRVEAGALLATLEPGEAGARLAAVASRVTGRRRERQQAKRELARAEALGGLVLAKEELERAQSHLDTVEAAHAQARAEHSGARSVVAEHALNAPFAGVVEARVSEVGAWVEAGDPIFELLGDEALEIRVGVEPSLRAVLRLGQRFEIRPLPTADAGGVPVSTEGRDAPRRSLGFAELISVSRALDSRTRTLELRLRPSLTDTTSTQLIAGGNVYVALAFEHPTPSGAVTVPRDALVEGAEGSRLVTVVQGRARLHPVELIASVGERVQVLAPTVEVGETVVVRGNERIASGQFVRVVETLEGASDD